MAVQSYDFPTRFRSVCNVKTIESLNAENKCPSNTWVKEFFFFNYHNRHKRFSFFFFCYFLVSPSHIVPTIRSNSSKSQGLARTFCFFDIRTSVFFGPFNAKQIISSFDKKRPRRNGAILPHQKITYDTDAIGIGAFLCEQSQSRTTNGKTPGMSINTTPFATAPFSLLSTTTPPTTPPEERPSTLSTGIKSRPTFDTFTPPSAVHHFTL